jgi:RNA-directed DNA polymerase
MYQYTTHKSELSAEQLRVLGQRFEHLSDTNELAQLLKCSHNTLLQLAEKPAYQQFHIPKPGGEKRFIQSPQPALKAVQQELNRYLQALYYGVKPISAHGFVLSPIEETTPRNIYSNALAHVRGQWFLNIDLKDFFHTITKKHIETLFEATFGFPSGLAALLAGLTTFQGRLPMGAPTSPVLSNWIFYFTDYELLRLTDLNGGTYSRYADDLTFSFQVHISDDFLDYVRHILLRQGFVINEKKLRVQNRLENPEITGLRLGAGPKPVLSKTFLKTLKKEVNVYNWLVSEAVRERALFPSWLFDQFRKSLNGQVEFAGFVLGKNDREYQKMAAKMRWGAVA